MKRIFLKSFIGIIISLALVYLLLPVSPTNADEPLAGVWSCQSVYGGAFTGRSCKTWPWLNLNSDKSYTWGSEKGKWEFKDNVLHLSGRKGTGRLNKDRQLIIEYESKGTKYQQTLFKRN